ncbi:MAG: hypothetical protein ACQESB_06540, partial [Elusimicrobiota bacterium]
MTKHKFKYTEKRKFARTRVKLPVKIKATENSDIAVRDIYSETVDLSERG